MVSTFEKFFKPYHKEYAKVNQRTGHQSAGRREPNKSVDWILQIILV
jgi:hypothetical protein